MSAIEENKQETKVEQELTEEQKKEEELYARLSSKKYLGLSNQGATCYMNSLLQSLYMTYQFRQKLYEWKYNPKKHNKEEDCLPLQLQILFARLQECTNRSFIDTKPLIHTFGWSNNQMFQQQDVQEFCRVLFDAIEQSFEHHKESEWLRDLYEGQTENFVYCKQCKTDSIRNDNFLDLQLIIRSDFDNVQNNSIEKCMKHFVKSVELEGDNQYFCETCNAKVNATKGVRFKTLPPILMLQLNRFDLDYETLQRKKICDRVYFPSIINMNEFFKKYEDIHVEEPPNPKEYEQKDQESSTTRSKILSKRKASFDEGNGQDCKPLFEDEPVIPKKYGSEQGDQEGQKEGYRYLDSVANNNQKIMQFPAKKKMVQRNPALFTRADEAYEYEQSLFNAVEDFSDVALFSDIPCKVDSKQSKLQEQQKQEGYTKKNVKIQNANANTHLMADEVYDIDQKGENDKHNDDNNEGGDGIDWSTTVPVKKQEDDMIKKFRETNQKRESERNREILKENIEANSQNHELINKYLQDGPYVYELYAVNVHSGGALGGHYFSYIKSFENGLWYNFNDSSVSKIRPTALEYVYGQENPKSNISIPQENIRENTSAYMLMYRQVGVDEQKEITPPSVPEQITKTLQEEVEQEKKRHEEQLRIQKLRERQIEFRIFKNQEDSQVFSFDKYVTTLNDVKLKVMEKYEIKEDLSNWRLRAYSNYEKIMQETFSQQLEIPLVDLNVKDWKDFIIEYKQANVEFEEYDPSKINVSIFIWEEKIALIENFGMRLTPNLKLLIKETDTLSQLMDVLTKELSISKEEIILLKKSNRSSNFRIMLLNDVESTLSFTLKQLDISNNTEVYVEKRSDSRTGPSSKSQDDKKFAWEVQIEKESHACTILFNNPKNNTKKGYSENNLEITIDNRCTLRDAKNLIAKKINLDVGKFIMKRNTLTNAEELKDLSIKLNNLSMIHRGTLFLSEGIPQSIDEFQIDYRICKKFETHHSLTINYESEHLTYMPTRTSMTVLELKEILVQKLKELRNIEVISPKCLRFQERYTEYKTIMKNDKTLREYMLYDKKVIGITILDKEEDLKNDDILIFTKFWDWKSREIQNSVELVMKQYYDSQDFMQMVATYYGMNADDIEAFYIQSIKNTSLEGIAYEINNWKSTQDNFTISLVPWFLARDAETFIIRDKNLFSENKLEIQNYLKGNTPDSLISESKSKYNDPNAQADVKGKLQYKPVEQALKINLKKKVVENDDDNNKQSEEKKEDTAEGDIGEQNSQETSTKEQNTTQNTESETTQSEKPKNESENNNDKEKPVQEASESNKKNEKMQERDNIVLATYPPTKSQSQQSQTQQSLIQEAIPRGRLVRFDDEINIDDEDAIMQQILLQSLQEYQNNEQKD